MLPSTFIVTIKKILLKKLKSEVKKVQTVWLASDEDREGEAIAWHLQESLKLDESNTKRIVFRVKSLKKQLKKPSHIQEKLTNLWLMLNKLEEFWTDWWDIKFHNLWRKVKGGLSAGRVQSVALRLIADREKEINLFKPNETFKKYLDYFQHLTTKSFKAKFRKTLFMINI